MTWTKTLAKDEKALIREKFNLVNEGEAWGSDFKTRANNWETRWRKE